VAEAENANSVSAPRVKRLDGSWSDAVPAPEGGDDLAAAWKVGQVVLEDFKVEDRFDTGGMGLAYKVRSQSTGELFAAKRTRLHGPQDLRDFLVEIQTWIDLPEHPHLVACRFFRTAGEEMVVFSEFVEGGTLSARIRERRLKAIDQILDVAIQLAWALDALHEHGLMHQDVKPDNVLLTADGIVQLNDFGLARAHAVAAGAQVAEFAGEATFRGMTPGYCSPEQEAIARGLAAGTPLYRLPKLTRQTDVWSWGVSVLEMFTGGRTWAKGPQAASTLEAHRGRSRTTGDWSLEMPPGGAEVLRKCFHEIPDQRWESMTLAAEALCQVYRATVGNEYPRTKPDFVFGLQQRHPAFERLTATSFRYPDPRIFLLIALREGGEDSEELANVLPPQSESRRAQAVADLNLYQEARRRFEELVEKGRSDMEPLLAELNAIEGIARDHAEDFTGAQQRFDQAAEIFQRLIHGEQRDDVAIALVEVFMNKGATLAELGDLSGSLDLLDRATTECERLIKQGQRTKQAQEAAFRLAHIHGNKGITFRRLGNLAEALKSYDRAIGILEHRDFSRSDTGVAAQLGRTFLNKAAALNQAKELDAAAEAVDRAIAILEHVVGERRQLDLLEMLASAYNNKGDISHERRAFEESNLCLDKAVEIRESLVNQYGLWELSENLASSYMNKGNTLRKLGAIEDAVLQHDRAIAIREKLVREQNRWDLANELARSYLNKALVLQELSDHKGAVELLSEVIDIRERLVREQKGGLEALIGLGNAYVNQANSLRDLGRKDEAIAFYDKAHTIWTQLIDREGHKELTENRLVTELNKTMAETGMSEHEVKALLSESREVIEIGDVPQTPLMADERDA